MIGVILVTILAIQLGLFPATSTISPDSGAEAWVYSMSLPVIALLINGVTGGAQQIRSAVIKQLERDYVRTLRSRGIGEREILFKHVLRSAAPAGLTVLSLQLIGMLGGVVIIEQIFALPGHGSAGGRRHRPVGSSRGDGRRDVHGGRRHCGEPAGGHSQWLAQPESTCVMSDSVETAAAAAPAPAAPTPSDHAGQSGTVVRSTVIRRLFKNPLGIAAMVILLAISLLAILAPGPGALRAELTRTSPRPWPHRTP